MFNLVRIPGSNGYNQTKTTYNTRERLVVLSLFIKKLALLAQISNRKPLNNKLRKLEFMLEIRRMVVEGSSYNEIQSKLGLSRRTFYRYLNAIFDKDRQVLRKVNEDEVMTQAAILRDRYNDIYQTLDAISKDRIIDAEQRINACGARAELSRSIAKIYTEAPAFIAIQNKKREQEAARQMIEQQQQEERQRLFAEDSKYDWRNTEYARNVSTEKDDDSEEDDSDVAEPRRQLLS